jgi:hypothetical protein
MVNQDKNVLKGHFNLARGKALGINTDQINRPRQYIEKRSILISDEKGIFFFLEDAVLSSVLKKYFTLINILSRTVSSIHHLPRVLPRAEMSRPFRPKNSLSTMIQ